MKQHKIFDEKEQIIVSFTTWHARINNIPTVLDSIFNQTQKPDFVVLNLAHDEVIPDRIKQYLQSNNVIINRVNDTKVYKKLIPTLSMFPEACIINIDDDFIYPQGMIEDFISTHKKHPNSPISGNYIVFNHLNCHCGCASLTKKEHFGDMCNLIDNDVIANCRCDDIVYTYFAARSGHYYLRTKNLYFLNMQGIDSEQPYSLTSIDQDNIASWNYLVNRFGNIKEKQYFQYYKMILKRWISRL